MRAFEILSEDAQVKRKVLKTLNKLPDENPIFPQVYKQIVGEPLGNRLSSYINNRNDQDAIKAAINDYRKKQGLEELIFEESHI